MTKRTLTVAAATALLIPAISFAQAEVVNGERGLVFKDAPSTLTRAEVRAQITAPAAAPGNWTYVGGEAGWVLSSHKYVFDGGQMTHAANCPVLAALGASKSESTGDLGYTGA
jgi:opacity protein-like surface antigen